MESRILKVEPSVPEEGFEVYRLVDEEGRDVATVCGPQNEETERLARQMAVAPLAVAALRHFTRASRSGDTREWDTFQEFREAVLAVMERHEHPSSLDSLTGDDRLKGLSDEWGTYQPEDGGFRQIKLSVTDGRDVRFEGRLVAQVTTPVRLGSSLGLTLYETRAGTLVLEKADIHIGRTYTSVSTYSSREELIADNGFSSLVKPLYEAAGFDTAVKID